MSAPAASSMHAIVLHQHGGPEQLQAADMPLPELREHDLLVEVHATSVNPVDTKVRRGPGGARALPITLGYDVSGVVVACGSRVQQWQVGDRIFAAPDLFRPGANAQYVAVDARSCARKPRNLDHASAATLPLVSLTAWSALHLRAQIAAGDTVFIQAGAGGVGHIAVQLARLHGCRVITTASRDASLDFCKEVLRADHVIDYQRENVVERVKALTDGRGVRVAIDTVGGDTFLQTLDCAAVNGQVVTILGADTGDRGQSLLLRGVTLHYEFMALPTTHGIDAERPGRVLTAIAQLVEAGLLRPHVSRRYPIAQIADAHRELETGHTIGKLAITF